MIVTGAAGGIGAAAVTVFLEAEAQVAGLFHATPPPDDLAGRCQWIPCDARDRRSVGTAFERATSALGGLDVLVHAVGSWRPSTPESLSDDEFDLVLDTNLRSTVLANQAAFERMRAGGGQIVNLGSSEGVRGNPLAPHYAMAKAGVHAWTRSAAAAWGRFGVTVNALAPAVGTPGAERLWAHLGDDRTAAFKERLRTSMPLRGELGDPETDLGPVLVFLAGPGARFMTGQLIAVDGGLQMLGA
ncbi:short-chain dehydrogenase/reductase SDR [Amycolatopsis mediterranei S699]|uniref:Short-chain dehydrogenase/reductase SDR n=2 Tax=Amycolatopsis mediterranei TaxID=33910 RepID=A0A0H3DD80_AMYMU|nr:short-chain dehydrogenase/reductase SDR [Amycolatopsis mediterranei U32]AEK45828.1 short-chain dehydrogenase/reductase SDR [Amycolatopsis mediterranei S699]AFO80588.1 short-chain dehydrogenase/reductase SDR [Amycolatopsis mediterranei S699]AGT87716.1 short-chain dehydrogenase/reductase SDR [Amycolatopsis mediterranei RB]